MSQIFFFTERGEINSIQSGTPADLVHYHERGLPCVLAADDIAGSQHYVVDGTLVARPVSPIAINRTEIPADKRTKVKIAGLPDPCTVFIEGEPVTVEGGLLELTADMPATYWVVFDSFPYMPWSAEITAT